VPLVPEVPDEPSPPEAPSKFKNHLTELAVGLPKYPGDVGLN